MSEKEQQFRVGSTAEALREVQRYLHTGLWWTIIGYSPKGIELAREIQKRFYLGSDERLDGWRAIVFVQGLPGVEPLPFPPCLFFAHKSLMSREQLASFARIPAGFEHLAKEGGGHHHFGGYVG